MRCMLFRSGYCDGRWSGNGGGVNCFTDRRKSGRIITRRRRYQFRCISCCICRRCWGGRLSNVSSFRRNRECRSIRDSRCRCGFSSCRIGSGRNCGCGSYSNWICRCGSRSWCRIRCGVDSRCRSWSRRRGGCGLSRYRGGSRRRSCGWGGRLNISCCCRLLWRLCCLRHISDALLQLCFLVFQLCSVLLHLLLFRRSIGSCRCACL